MPHLKAYILCHNARSNPLYSSWLDGIEHVVVEDYDQDWNPPEDCGVVVSHLHYDYPTSAILRRITERNEVPVLVLADGILEFRNTFENPGVAAGSVFMPVHGHKIACIGYSQARQVEAWGNHGKAEVVGLPRLDEYRSAQPKSSGDFRVLVVTARQPGFTDLQRSAIQKSLVDLRDWFERNPESGGRRIEPVWRLTGGLAERIGVANHNDNPSIESVPIQLQLAEVQAVVSTPSTTVVEAMLMNLPTAVLDYTNSPKYVTAAWNITAEEHLTSTILNLMSPPANRMDFQRAALSDALQTSESATERMVKLVKRLIEYRGQSRLESRPLNIPPAILEDSIATGTEDPRSGVSRNSLATLFPCQIGFRANEIEALTTQYQQLCASVDHLHQKIDQQRRELASARQQVRIAWRHHDYASDQVKWLRAEIQRLNLALRISRRPTRMQRRLRVRASIAFQRWQFFVERIRELSSPRKVVFDLERLFEMTRYPKGNKLPATVRNYESNTKRNPQIKIWKIKPASALVRRMNRAVVTGAKRLKAKRVMRAR